MMAGNPSWWSMHLHPPSPSVFPQYVVGSPPPLLDNHELPQSWSQLLMGGFTGEEERYGGPSPFQPRKLENWDNQILNPSLRAPVVEVKQEVTQHGNLYGHHHAKEEFQTPRPPPPAAAAWSQLMAVSSPSPRSCITSSSSNMLDFSYNNMSAADVSNSDTQPPLDHSSECNSKGSTGGVWKKARVQPSSSQPPLKVRKEKLGDRITALHQLVSPFGKLENVHSHIEKYFVRFRNLLGPGNRRYIQTLLVLTRAFLRVLLNDKDGNCLNTCPDAKSGAGENKSFDSSMAINEFLFSLNIDNINLIKLLQYIKESNIMHKVSGYGDKTTSLQKGSVVKENGESCDCGSILSGFQVLATMLLSLTNNDGDGRIIISRKRPTSSGQGAYLKYVMLTGEKIFSQIVHEAHAVVLAGGTLQPIEETRERLFPWLPSDQLHFFSCSHIVPPESILPLAVSRGPSGRSFDFSYGLRSSSTMIEELGLLLCNLATVVPEGIVVFFSSFEYEGQVYDAWKTSGILERIMKRKHVLREPRKSTEIEVILKEYKEAIDNPGPKSGAILLAVVGGKISEGINFSDGMGRCIVMVGLPYPSPSDIELLERVKHIEGLGDSSFTKSLKLSTNEEFYGGDVQSGFSILRSCRRRGREYYENLCMKAVNQSIGRAIRHVNDYAAILLVDIRYTSDSSKKSLSHPSSKLPQWIKDRLISATNNYGEVHKLLHQFFRFNKNKG